MTKTERLPKHQDVGVHEDSLIQAVITFPESFDEIEGLVTGADFRDPDRGKMFDCLKVLRDAGIPIDSPPVMVPELRRMGISEELINLREIAEILTMKTLGRRDAHFHATEVRRSAVLRKIEGVAIEMQAKFMDDDCDPLKLRAWADAKMQSATVEVGSGDESVGAVSIRVLEEIARPRPGGRGMMIGIESHDRMVGGFQPGELVILAARPSVGKTALAMQIAEHCAEKGRATLAVSLEMSSNELVTRMICGRSGVDTRRIRAGQCQLEHLEAMRETAAQIQDWPLQVWAPPSATVAQIRGVAKQRKATTGLDLLIVDYIGLVKPEDSRQPRHEQISRVSASLKVLAKELEIPVLALSQLNRDAEGERPKLSQLRDSGSLEQDADIVIMLHRESRAAAEAVLIIAKHRHGEVGDIDLRWDSVGMRYADKPTPNEFQDYNDRAAEADRASEVAFT